MGTISLAWNCIIFGIQGLNSFILYLSLDLTTHLRKHCFSWSPGNAAAIFSDQRTGWTLYPVGYIR